MSLGATLLEGHGLVICTYRRKRDLARTLGDITACNALPEQIVVVHGVEVKEQTALPQNASDSTAAVQHLYCEPGLTKQRNAGINALGNHIHTVHFIDDDFSPAPTYFSALAAHFDHHPEAIGAGGVFDPLQQPSSIGFWKRLFLLDSLKPGIFLGSGQTSESQARADLLSPDFTEVEWLSGCSFSFRRSLFDSERFNEALTGAAIDEDLEFCLRAGKQGILHSVSAARGLHRKSSATRSDRAQAKYQGYLHRFWILMQHKPGMVSELKFLWGLMGSLLALKLNPHDNSDLIRATFAALRAILQDKKKPDKLLNRSLPG